MIGTRLQDKVEDKQSTVQDAHRCQPDRLVLRFRTLKTYADILSELSDLERLIGPLWMGPRTEAAEQSWIVVLLPLVKASLRNHVKRASSSGISFQPSRAFSPNLSTKRVKRTANVSLVGGSSFRLGTMLTLMFQRALKDEYA